MARNSASQGRPLLLNEVYQTLEEEIAARRVEYSATHNISLEEADKRITLLYQCRIDKLKPPASVIPKSETPVEVFASRTRSAKAAPSQVSTASRNSVPEINLQSIASMPPGGGRQEKKAKDASRASASRNTTPSSIAGNAVDPAITTPSPRTGARLLTKPTTYKQFQPPQDTLAGSSAPDSETITRLEQHGKVIYSEAQNDRDEMEAIKPKVVEQERKLGLNLDQVEEEGDDTSGFTEAVKGEDVDNKSASATDKKAKKTRRKKPKASAADRPLTHGAHAVAPQDGSNLGKSLCARYILLNIIALNRYLIQQHTDFSPSDNSKLAAKAPGTSRDPDTASSSLSPAQTTPVAAAIVQGDEMDVDVPEDIMSEVQPEPARPHEQKLIFGNDPTKFADPTVYEITKVKPGMSDEEIKRHAGVASFPRSDLSDLTAGIPPDRDYVQSKPTNQVQASTFATYTESYLRPYTEEDMAWLRERGDRRTPFIMPALGKRHYKEIWAEEDGLEASEDGPRKQVSTEANGSMDDMNDAVAEAGEFSAGPAMSRFMALFRNEHRPQDDSGAANGEEETGENDDLAAILEGSASRPANSRTAFPPATRLAEPATEPGRKYVVPKQSADDREKRLMEELTYAGFLPEGSAPDYDESADDEVAAVIRHLQAQLRVTMLQNAARKSIVQERMSEQMAYQEYNHIADDLDSQVTNQYQKRTRTMGKKNKKRSGGAGGGANAVGGGMAGVAKPGLEGATKTAMDRRKKWMEQVGSVFDDPNLGKVPRAADEGSSIFTKEAMAKHMAKEAALMEEEDAEADDE